MDEENLHFFAARVSKNVLQKFDHAVSLYGKKKQRCTEEALDMFSDAIIAEYHNRSQHSIRVKV